jgi:hypothetical protein
MAIMHLLLIPVLFGLALYFLPSIIGARKRNAGAIFALNLLLGWTLIGWVVALVWALTKEDVPTAVLVQPWTAPAPQAWSCPVCHLPLSRSDLFCRSCGNRIAWPG